MLRIVRWVRRVNFNRLSALDGTARRLAAGWRLRNGEAAVVTSVGGHRLRLVARIGDRVVVVVPDTPARRPLETLVEWASKSLRDGVVLMDEWRRMREEAA